MWHFYFKQRVEIATLSSVARNDSARLEVAVHQQITCDDVTHHSEWAAIKQTLLQGAERQGC